MRVTIKGSARRKYSNIKETIDGHTFASRAEARRYLQLKQLQAAKVIRGLELHPRFPLVVNGEKLGYYEGDFCYYEEGRTENPEGFVLEDVKNEGTITPIFRLKRKLVRALHKLEITLVASR